MRIILTGIAGRLGRRVAQRLSRNHQVIGIDRRPCLGLPDGVVHHRVDLRRRPAEDVFRNSNADAVLHMGVVHNFRIPSEKLYARNVIGTETLLQYASKYKLKKVVLLSSGDVYGPSPTNSHFIDEDAPLMASQRFPEIRTLVAVDRTVQSFFWRHHDIETVILRPAHIVGPNVRNAPSNYLRLRIIPTQMGFDPMVQLIHEDDALRMIEAALAPGVRGVFNLAGTEPVPLQRILKILGKPVLPIPHPLFRAGLERAWKYRLTSFPPPELDHIRFNTVLDTSRAREVLKVLPERGLYEILEPFR
ncbi:MAG TPA: NAD-dependent epimerase/dehydratase family protein, partial [Myxococcota bacterium]|nr:NAD-dependent epimerase/dehydratase family protein [Myxococcota bacterium]